MRQVIIDGVEYIPKDTTIPKEVVAAYKELRGQIWTEAHYDPYNEATETFARKLEKQVAVVDWLLGEKP